MFFSSLFGVLDATCRCYGKQASSDLNFTQVQLPHRVVRGASCINCSPSWRGRESTGLRPSELGALRAAPSVDLMDSGFRGDVLKCSNKNVFLKGITYVALAQALNHIFAVIH